MKSYCNQEVCQAPLGIALRLLWVGTKSRVTSPLLRWLQSLIIASIVTLCGIPARQGLARVRRKTSGRNDTVGPITVCDDHLFVYSHLQPSNLLSLIY